MNRIGSRFEGYNYFGGEKIGPANPSPLNNRAQSSEQIETSRWLHLVALLGRFRRRPLLLWPPRDARQPWYASPEGESKSRGPWLQPHLGRSVPSCSHGRHTP